MDLALLMKIFSLATSYGPTVLRIVQTATSNGSISDKIKNVAPDLVDVLTNVGSQLFPKAEKDIKLVGAAIAAFDSNYTVWLQKSLNTMVTPSPNLEVDGIYGAKTRAAVEQIQAQMGLKVDGVAGKLTQSAIQAALVNLPQIK